MITHNIRERKNDKSYCDSRNVIDLETFTYLENEEPYVIYFENKASVKMANFLFYSLRRRCISTLNYELEELTFQEESK